MQSGPTSHRPSMTKYTSSVRSSCLTITSPALYTLRRTRWHIFSSLDRGQPRNIGFVLQA